MVWAEVYLRREGSGDFLVLSLDAVESGNPSADTGISLAMGSLGAGLFTVFDSEGHADAVGEKFLVGENEWREADPREWGTVGELLDDGDEEVERGL